MFRQRVLPRDLLWVILCYVVVSCELVPLRVQSARRMSYVFRVLITHFVLRTGRGVPGGYGLGSIDLRFKRNYVTRLRLKSIFSHPSIALIPTLSTGTTSGNIVGHATFSCVRSAVLRAIRRRLSRLSNVCLRLRNTDRMRNVNSNSRRVLGRIHHVMNPCVPVTIMYSPRNGLYGRCIRNAALVHDCHRSPRASIRRAVHFIYSRLLRLLRRHHDVAPICHGLPLVLNNRRDISTSRPIHSVGRCVSRVRGSSHVLDTD